MKTEIEFSEWLKQKVKEYRILNPDKEMFLGIPDEWYEQGLHCCKNGHVNSSYLKSSEKGSVCFNCGSQSYIFPTGIESSEFSEQMNRNDR